jgi:hypothetical protein
VTEVVSKLTRTQRLSLHLTASRGGLRRGRRAVADHSAHLIDRYRIPGELDEPPGGDDDLVGLRRGSLSAALRSAVRSATISASCAGSAGAGNAYRRRCSARRGGAPVRPTRRPPGSRVERAWKRRTAAERSTYTHTIACRAAGATDRSRRQHPLAPYKQEVARSSRAPPILLPATLQRGTAASMLDHCCFSRRAEAQRALPRMAARRQAGIGASRKAGPPE